MVPLWDKLCHFWTDYVWPIKTLATNLPSMLRADPLAVLRAISSRHVALGGVAILSVILVAVSLLRLPSASTGDAALPAKEADTASITINGVPLTIPKSMIRFADQQAGSVPRVDTIFLWPQIQGRNADNEQLFVDPEHAGDIIHLSIYRQISDAGSTDRLAAVYARFFAGPPQTAPYGLIIRNFSAGSAYEGEYVAFESGVTDPFVARCYRPKSQALPAICSRDVNIGNSISYTYRFHHDRLNDWRHLDASIAMLVRQFQGR